MINKPFPATRGTIVQQAQVGGLNNFDVLVVGQKIGGTATAGALIENIISESEVNTYFGRTSHIAKLLRAVLKDFNKSTVKSKLSAISLADNGITKATGTFTITGTATEQGTLIFYVDSKTNGKFAIDVLSGETATQVGAKLQTAVTNYLNRNYSASNTTGTVTITALNAGTNGNTILLDFEGSVAGLTVAKSADYLASGATDPVLTGLFDVIADQSFKFIVYPATYNYEFISDYTNDNFNVTRGLKYSTAIQTKVDTYSNLSALYALYPTDKAVLRGRLHPDFLVENPDVMSAQLASKLSLFLTPDADVDFAQDITKGAIKNIGLPYAQLVFNDIQPLPTGTGFSKEENEVLDGLGSFTFYNNESNTAVLLGELFTGSVKDDLGIDNDTFKYQSTVDGVTYSRRFILKSLQSQFQRYKLTTGVAGDRLASYGTMKSAIMRLYKQLAQEYGILIDDNNLFTDVENVIDQTAVIDLGAGSYATTLRLYLVGQVRFIDITFVVKI
jgi:phage tail sheath gpL-like